MTTQRFPYATWNIPQFLNAVNAEKAEILTFEVPVQVVWHTYPIQDKVGSNIGWGSDAPHLIWVVEFVFPCLFRAKIGLQSLTRTNYIISPGCMENRLCFFFSTFQNKTSRNYGLPLIFAWAFDDAYSFSFGFNYIGLGINGEADPIVTWQL